MDNRFRVTVEHEKERATLAVLTDKLEMSDAGPFAIACAELLATGQPELFVDLCAVEHIPSTVVTELLRVYDRATGDGGRLVVACREMASRVLQSLMSGAIELV